jgi:hypothetical protein
MSFSVTIHAPKTPVTAGSGGEAKATLPNVCKMPGPPAPFVPSPLPNIAKSGNSPKDYSTSVLIEGEKIAIRGATFESMGDVASKGTGGGLISANTQGPAKFIPPGTMDVKIEGKGVHLKGDQMLNNCASGGTPPNTGATMMGVNNPKGSKWVPEIAPDCADKKKNDGWDDCMCGQVCEMIKAYNRSKKAKRKLSTEAVEAKDVARQEGVDLFAEKFAKLVKRHAPNLNHPSIKKMFYSPPDVDPPDCQHAKWVKSKAGANPIRSGKGAMNPDHMHPVGLNGSLAVSNLKWADARVNYTVGAAQGKLKPAPKKMKAHPSCNCD